jgi:hypothetical protein
VTLISLFDEESCMRRFAIIFTISELFFLSASLPLILGGTYSSHTYKRRWMPARSTERCQQLLAVGVRSQERLGKVTPNR